MSLLRLIGFREEVPLDWTPGAPENARMSPDEDRELNLALKNSVTLSQFYNRIGQRNPMHRVFSQATWIRQLQLLQWRAAYRRRHPSNNPQPPQAA